MTTAADGPTLTIHPSTQMHGAAIPTCKRHPDQYLQFAWKKEDTVRILRSHFYWCRICDGPGPARRATK